MLYFCGTVSTRPYPNFRRCFFAVLLGLSLLYRLHVVLRKALFRFESKHAAPESRVNSKARRVDLGKGTMKVGRS